MKLTFFDNACCIIEEQGYNLLCDPWLSDGIFDGAWYHYPPLKVKPQDLAHVDAIYISHIHPDHYDEESLKHFPKDMPIISLDQEPNFLKFKLEQFGFKDITLIKHEETQKVGPFEMTMYAPFSKRVYDESNIGNLIDSSFVVKAGGQTILNANDNNPDIEWAHKLKERHGKFNCAMLPYNGAGPYPSCFDNLSKEEKMSEHHRRINQNLEHLIKVSNIMEPDYVMPFGGSYVIGGSNWEKNECLGVSTWDVAGDYISEHSKISPLILSEGLTFDFSSEKIINGEYKRLDTDHMANYIKSLANNPYPFEKENLLGTIKQEGWFRESLPIARTNLWKHQGQLEYKPDLNFFVELENDYFYFNFNSEESVFVSKKEANLEEPYLTATMHPNMLTRILLFESHWNNIEIGCHITFKRFPNKYLPDVHTLLSFFHLPKTMRESIKN
jgi:UDP-MurNAc hydroxylase